MMVKNAIVLVDEIGRLQTEEHMAPYTAVVEATVSRVRPVMMASLTTIVGMIRWWAIRCTAPWPFALWVASPWAPHYAHPAALVVCRLFPHSSAGYRFRHIHFKKSVMKRRILFLFWALAAARPSAPVWLIPSHSPWLSAAGALWPAVKP